MDFEGFLDLHEPQLLLSGIPVHLWERLFVKLNEEVFDAGDYFAMIQQENDEESGVKGDNLNRWQVVCTKDVVANDPNSVFLIDHAWTFRWSGARAQLSENANLLQRLCDMMEIKYEMSEEEEDGTSAETTPILGTLEIDTVLEEMWKYAQTYSIRAPGMSTENQMPVWYIMDEFGSRIQHSDLPAARLVPFYFAGSQTFFSVMFLVKDLAEGEELTRDFVEASDYRKKEWRKYYMLPWFHVDCSELSVEHKVPEDTFFVVGSVKTVKGQFTRRGTVHFEPCHDKNPIHAARSH